MQDEQNSALDTVKDKKSLGEDFFLLQERFFWLWQVVHHISIFRLLPQFMWNLV